MTLNNIVQEVDEFIDRLIQKAENYYVSIESGMIKTDQLLSTLANEKITDIKKRVVDKWAEYGWVPVLPTFQGKDIIKNIVPPDTSEEADKIMLKYLNESSLQELFLELKGFVTINNHNEKTLSEAILSYKNGLYSACSLLIFALIDACFLTRQPTTENKRRVLTEKAASSKIKRVDSLVLSCADITLHIVKSLFLNADDFNPQKEVGLNRNFISHGMNRYNPDDNDCLKLFVLLFNIYLLFDTAVFEWIS